MKTVETPIQNDLVQLSDNEIDAVGGATVTYLVSLLTGMCVGGGLHKPK